MGTAKYVGSCDVLGGSLGGAEEVGHVDKAITLPFGRFSEPVGMIFVAQ